MLCTCWEGTCWAGKAVPIENYHGGGSAQGTVQQSHVLYYMLFFIESRNISFLSILQ